MLAPLIGISVLVCQLLMLPTTARAEGGLPAPVARVAAALGVPAENISLWVQVLGAETPLAQHLPDTPRNPASVLKLVATFAALQELNPAYRWRTELHALGPIENEVLKGELLIRGTGDPFLVIEDFWSLLGGLRRTGLRRIEGGLVFDVSHFDLPAEDPGLFDNQPDRVYNLAPHPLLINFNAMRFEFQPGGDGHSVRVVTAPELPNVSVANRLRLRAGACGGYQRGVALNVRNETRNEVLLEGDFPSTCSVYGMTRSVLQPESYAFGLFDLYWSQLGGSREGSWRIGELASIGQRAGRPLYVHESRPLGDIVRMVNKYSNNVITPHLALTLGAERFGAPATPEKGRRAIMEILAENRIDTQGMVLDNISGLSRDVRVSAHQVGQLLARAWDAPIMPEFVSSLALTGLDGTMQRRFRNHPAQGRMHLKTGTLDDVSGIAGYVHTRDNRRLAVVMLVNSPNAHRGPGEELQNALLEWAFRQ
jgi:D-alanyl-D-alanine carboxypeptidase/D-alanyl-D-alanine-endopeptidase (penicillin-binding protein 4)